MARKEARQPLNFKAFINTDPSHPRLQGILVSPTPESYYLPPPRLLVIDPRLIGRHERFKFWKLGEINLKRGWHGAGVAVGAIDEERHAKPEENVVWSQINEILADSITGVGVLEMPAHLKKRKEKRQFKKQMRKTLFAIDGHHRLAKSRLRRRYVVAQIFPFPDEKNLDLDTWLHPRHKLTQHQVVDVVLEDRRVKSKQTKFSRRMHEMLRKIKLSKTQKVVYAPRENLERKPRRKLLRLGRFDATSVPVSTNGNGHKTQEVYTASTSKQLTKV